MKKILFTTAAMATFLAATPAAATEGLAKTAPVGPRVEAVVGYDNVEAGDNSGGFLFGIGAGYDFAVSPTVSLGVDAEATGSTQNEGDSDFSFEPEAKRDLYAGVRASLAVSPTVNLYIKGGYTNARFKGDDEGDSFSENFDGYRLGAGGQLAVHRKAYVGAEYRYSNYEDGLKRHQVALTVGTRF